jgi:hypothetical protein
LPSGAVDVVLLPNRGQIKLVLVETKVSSAADANSKVIGQLLMYYTGALTLVSRGVRMNLHHDVGIGLVVVRNGKIESVSLPGGQESQNGA